MNHSRDGRFVGMRRDSSRPGFHRRSSAAGAPTAAHEVLPAKQAKPTLDEAFELRSYIWATAESQVATRIFDGYVSSTAYVPRFG